MIYVVGPKDRKNYPNIVQINTTSSSLTWSKGLSPFFLGPIDLYQNFKAQNLENAWQFSKVYPEHFLDGKILDSYWDWAKKGWASSWAHRYPMGKGKKPLFGLWDGENLNYVESRKKIYAPLYIKAVTNTPAFKELQRIYQEKKELVLFDFDGYDYKGLNMSLKDVLNNPNKKMGHAFLLAMLLMNDDALKEIIF